MSLETRAAVTLAIVVLVVAGACRPSGPHADVILTNARVYTLRWSDPAPDGTPARGAPYSAASGWHPDAAAIAIAGGKILYVGTADSALAFRRDSTRVIDVGGETIVPGLIDAHAHVLALGASFGLLGQRLSPGHPLGPGTAGVGGVGVEHANAPPTVEETAEVLRQALDTLAAAGYAMVHEVGASLHEMLALESLSKSNGLPIRVYAILSGRDTAVIDEWFTRRGADSVNTGNLIVRAVELVADSTLDSHGARLLADYADRPGTRGLVGPPPPYDTLAIAEMMEHGFQLVVDATGDDANRRTLDFIQSVMATNADAAHSRVRIEHADVLSAVDIPRFVTVGVIASMQPARAIDDMATAEARLGAGRMREVDAWRSLRLATARLAFGSDLPAGDYNIFHGLHSAITRRAGAGPPTSAAAGDETMTPEEALRGFTSWAAYASYDERHSGRIMAGMRADLTVLTMDPMTVTRATADTLLAGKIAMTIVGGRVVYERR